MKNEKKKNVIKQKIQPGVLKPDPGFLGLKPDSLIPGRINQCNSHLLNVMRCRPRKTSI
jgi:hypothetical protein